MYSTLIIGAGQIGAFYDSPDSPNILTHAHAFTRHEAFDIIGFFDIKIENAVKAAKIWNTNYFETLDSALKNNSIDVACVAVPDEFHYYYLNLLSQTSVKIIFIEKPMVVNLSQANDIPESIKDKILVNFSRRFVPQFVELKNFINQKCGKYLSGTGYYGKGINHNGSHFLDLLMYLIGNIVSCQVVKSEYDFYINDPSVSGIVKFDNGNNFYIQNINCNNYTVFELDLFFEMKRIRIINSGFEIQVYNIKENELFKGYKILDFEKETKTELGQSMFFAANNVFNFLSKGSKLVCNFEDSLKVLNICEHFR